MSSIPKRQSINLWMDALCCFFIAAGFLYALYRMMPESPAYPWAYLAFPVLTVLVCALIRPRFLLPLLGLGALAGLFYLLRHPDLWQLGLSYFDWWFFQEMPESLLFADRAVFVAYALVGVGASAMLWLIIRIWRPIFLLGVICLTPLFILTISDVDGHMFSIFLMGLGLIPLAASKALAKPAKRRIKGPNQTLGQASLLALPLALICLLATFIFIPQDTAAWRNESFSDNMQQVYENVVDRYQIWALGDAGVPSFDLKYSDEFWGPVEPGNTPMLWVHTNLPQLLKGSCYDHYTGHGWEKSSYLSSLDQHDDGTYFIIMASGLHKKIVPFVPQDYSQELTRFLGYLPSPLSNHVLAPFVAEVTADIRLLHPNEPRLFSFGRPIGFYSESNITPFVEAGSELITLTQTAGGDSYSLTSLVLDRTLPGFQEAMVQSLNVSLPDWQTGYDQLSTGDVNQLISSELNKYTQIPESLSSNITQNDIFELTREITEGASSPYEEALLLEKWLKDNCAYTLTPAELPEDKDPVCHFLETREGYCKYYATAMAMMARTIGIPSRYITGYALRPLNGLDTYEATEATAHAWVELHFPGVGWLPFDPTGHINLSDTIVQSEGIETERTFAPFGESNNQQVRADSNWLLYPGLAGAVLLLAWLVLSLRGWAKNPRRRARIAGRGEALEIYYQDMQKQIDLLGWQQETGETVLTFNGRLGRYLPQKAAVLDQMAMAVCAWRYGQMEPDRKDLVLAASLTGNFEIMLRNQLKNSTYYIKRVLRL
ncbi:MAG: transglutaminase-like domain-containing protein [Clostridiales bacterium]|jgi:transglutaminase-like putative cysteine protease|nr:transglutaminase-like domain-containing protein [Clostridiales bacterium]